MPDTPPKAYNNHSFLAGASARPIRILSEYIEPRSRLDRHRVRDTIVFFGSARFVDGETAEKAAAAAETDEQRRVAERMRFGAGYYEAARELSARLTKWADEVKQDGRHFIICTGGGPGIMEAANRGAHEAGGRSIGFNISLPNEQQPNPYITPELSFQFHYFFMRKLWFAYLSKALLVFPGGFGTLDELMELLTLVQTDKLRKRMLVLVYGSEYWRKVLNFDALVEAGVIDSEDLQLFRFVDTVDDAFNALTSWLTEHYL